jgi:hypothetical protein
MAKLFMKCVIYLSLTAGRGEGAMFVYIVKVASRWCPRVAGRSTKLRPTPPPLVPRPVHHQILARTCVQMTSALLHLRRDLYLIIFTRIPDHFNTIYIKK